MMCTTAAVPLFAQSASTIWGAPTDVPVVGDFDGDGQSDIAVWRPSTGYWYIIQSSNGAHVAKQWGASTDVPIVGDFDGDGKSDIAVWRPSTGYWYIIQSSNGEVVTKQWGATTDVPVVGDFEGDGKSDIAVWRPATGYWYIIQSSNGAIVSKQWGAPTDVPFVGDYDGDGKSDFAVWRPSTGSWYIIQSSNDLEVTKQWGAPTDVPVVGDFDGDGKSDIAVFRPSTGYWYIVQSGTGHVLSQQWGETRDVPVQGRYGGGTQTDTAVWRPSSGTWYLQIPAASVSPSTFAFTGTVTSATGPYSSIAVGSPVTGTYTFNLANEIASQSSGTVGSTSGWESEAKSGPGTQVPKLGAAIFSSTATVGSVSYQSGAPGSGVQYEQVGSEGRGFYYEAQELTDYGYETASVTQLYSHILIPLGTYSVDGLPILSDGTVGQFGTLAGQVQYNVTSLTLVNTQATAPPAPTQQYAAIEIPPATYPYPAPTDTTTPPIGYALSDSGEVTGYIGSAASSPAILLGQGFQNFANFLSPASGATLFQYQGTVQTSVIKNGFAVSDTIAGTDQVGYYDPPNQAGGYLCNVANGSVMGLGIIDGGVGLGPDTDTATEITGVDCESALAAGATGGPIAFSYVNEPNHFPQIVPEFTLLVPPGTPGVVASWGQGINHAGSIVGTLREQTGTCAKGPVFHTFAYGFNYDPPFRDLGTFWGCSSSAFAVNDSNQIAGELTDTSGNPHAYLATPGSNGFADVTPADLGNLGQQFSVAYALNYLGQVVGVSHLKDGTPEAFLYSNAVIQDIGNLGGTGGSQANAIDDAGQVTGMSWTTGNVALHAFLYSGGSTMVDLNTLIANDCSCTLVDGVATNGTNLLVQGYRNSNPNQLVTFLLTPVHPITLSSSIGAVRVIGNNYYVPLTITNTGGPAILQAYIASAEIVVSAGGSAVGTPAIGCGCSFIYNLVPGASATVDFSFPVSAGAPGTPAVLQWTLNYAHGGTSGTPRFVLPWPPAQ